MSIAPKSTDQIEPPRIGTDLEQRTDLPGAPLDDEARYDALELTGARVLDARASRVIVATSRLRSVSLAAGVLPGLELIDDRLDDCDLANIEIESGSLERVELVGCRLVGLKAPESRWRDVVARECNASLAQFRYATFRRVRFEHCDLRSADFLGADLRGVVFDDCDLRNATLSSTRLAGADLSTSRIEGLQVGIESLRGAIVEPLQAAQLAALMGLKILWEGPGD